MQPLRRAYLLAILAALAAGLTIIPAAAAKTVVDTFAVTYDVKTTYDHHKAHPEFIGEDNLRYRLHGRLPELTFVDGLLQTSRSAAVKARVKGFAGSEVKQDTWSMNCIGKTISIRGPAGVARVGSAIAFLPALSAEPRGTCLASDGVRSPLTFDAAWPGEGLVGARRFPLTARSIDVPRWSKPFRIVFQDEKCPGYEPDLTIACSFVMEGKLTLIRVDREER
ncbi:MAG: hypothetical protein JST08_11535 [Actinobacteria bacterium]|nr:hypothetical protein [Actinomycetota bacterium]